MDTSPEFAKDLQQSEQFAVESKEHGLPLNNQSYLDLNLIFSMMKMFKGRKECMTFMLENLAFSVFYAFQTIWNRFAEKVPVKEDTFFDLLSPLGVEKIGL